MHCQPGLYALHTLFYESGKLQFAYWAGTMT